MSKDSRKSKLRPIMISFKYERMLIESEIEALVKIESVFKILREACLKEGLQSLFYDRTKPSIKEIAKEVEELRKNLEETEEIIPKKNMGNNFSKSNEGGLLYLGLRGLADFDAQKSTSLVDKFITYIQDSKELEKLSDRYAKQDFVRIVRKVQIDLDLGVRMRKGKREESLQRLEDYAQSHTSQQKLFRSDFLVEHDIEEKQRNLESPSGGKSKLPTVEEDEPFSSHVTKYIDHVLKVGESLRNEPSPQPKRASAKTTQDNDKSRKH